MKKNIFNNNMTKKHGWKNFFTIILSLFLLTFGIFIIYLSRLNLPEITQFNQRQAEQSTKIYDRTGKTLLYSVYQDKKRTIVPFDQISTFAKQATLAIEDKDFYNHKGIVIKSIIRSILVDITSLSLSQGGSTITQQVVKNVFLNTDKSFTRKFKELILTKKLENLMSKDDIFNTYLNYIHYGGTNYGIEEASQSYFGIKASELDLAQSAYLAAIPQASSRYSPYGKNRDKLDLRKNTVLKEMLDQQYITEDQYNSAVVENVTFLPSGNQTLKAPHFVTYIEKHLEEKYGNDVLQNGGLKVITTLDYEIQSKAEVVAKKYADINKINFNGSNDAFVVIDPKTGQILTMVGSSDFFSTTIDGQFNVTTAHRQPGSAFKPFVYAEAFRKGFTPETILFDVPTQFSTNCDVDNFTSKNGCYSPVNYDNKFRGPITTRNSLAQSLNIPSVKLLYLAGIQDSINLAENMGINSLGNPNQYGLTLVLGGGEVSLLDMTSAYGVFANDGIRNPYTGILEIKDKNENIIEQYQPNQSLVLEPEVARNINDILSDNTARTPLYGANSGLYFPGISLAAKTGTTNDYRDAWVIGYTPEIVVGTWAGNNDNSPMANKVSGLIVVPMWRELMDQIIDKYSSTSFISPQQNDSYKLKPVLRGKWNGGISTLTVNGSIINTDYTDSVEYSSIQESLSGGIHSILYWLNKNDIHNPNIPGNNSWDPQYKYWEYAINKWLNQN